jgi:hypothetical protein
VFVSGEPLVLRSVSVDIVDYPRLN